MRLAAGGLGVALVLGACSLSAKPTPSSPAPGSGSTTSVTSTGLAVKGAPAALAALVRTTYAGHPARNAVATLGTWHGSRVSVVTMGDDVTLAVAAKSGSWKVVGGWWPSLGKPTPQVGGRRFILAMGSDARVSKGQKIVSSRADALQVVGVDGRGGGGVLGLARDLWVPLATGGHGKINSAMVFGGPTAQAKTVASVTGLPIQGYLLMGFQGVEKTVDAMGGLPIVLAKPIHGVGVRIDLSAGPHVLTGKQVLAYARERKSLPDGDFGRSAHQGDLIVAAALRAATLGVGVVPTVMTRLDGTTVSNLSATQLLTFAAGLYVLSPTKVGRYVAKGSFGTAEGQSIVRLDAASRAAFARFRDGRL